MLHKKYIIAGMLMEVIEDTDDKVTLLNHTTHETVLIDKTFLDKSIRQGKVEELSESGKE